MKRRTVILAPEAEADLLALYEFVADAASPRVAATYLERIEVFVRGFETAAERGTSREDLRPGLRIVGYERRVTIAFTVSDTQVTVLRVFARGLDWERSLAPDASSSE